ncbi:hypothetical protein [Alkalimonas amylolytica]|uniref:Uncharacterized protein n=1 Tax=Alkalimonas amylolytica TaxID=152573 RepID=A0A1H4CQH2_ALKAM|nr:hypothetical protein [Alkalimonas amylolytica]SEA62614.1 hypothetical protein SAMN04488051_104280 [Alkalimonas amylolytica]
MSSKPNYCLFKSQLAGFFALGLLLGCQPSPPNPEQALMDAAQTDARAAHRLAQHRLAGQEFDAALRWFEHAWILGQDEAATPSLMLRQRQTGKLATAQWLEQQIQAQRISHQGVDLAALGLWHLHYQQKTNWPYWQQAGLTDQPGWQPEQGCQLTIQPIAINTAAANQWLKLQAEWQQDNQLATLPVCFRSLQLVSSTELACSEDSDSRIGCDYHQLIPYIRDNQAQQLLILAGRGKASYNNGIIQLPERAELSLLRHEFLHIFRFMDEYALPAAAAAEVCQPDQIYPNILIGKQQLAAYQQHWGRLPDVMELTPVDTCLHSPYQAYRLIAESNSMEFYQLDLPDYYVQLVKQQLKRPELLMPVQYYLAYKARIHGLEADWWRLMQLAEQLGYPDASRLLSQRDLTPTAPVPVVDHRPDSAAPAALSD